MLKTYWDESMAEVFGKPLLVLAAYVAPEEKWRALEGEWKDRVLKAFSIPYFHSAELRSRKHKLYRHLNLAARKSLLSTVCEVVMSNVTAGFAVYMRPGDLKAINHGTGEESLGRRVWRVH
jgi:hypothetical protein